MAVVRQAVQKHRQRISLAKAELEEALAVKFCERTLSRFLKNLMLGDKRIRKRPKGVENAEIYKLKVEILGALGTTCRRAVD
ncbi:MAG: hypothetical protein ACR2MG_17355 [Pyrinomonadaceae bacterium]